MSDKFNWSFERRFMSKVTVQEGGCWIWNGSKMRNGYGQLGVAGKHYAAHRYSYENKVGPIPIGLDLDHLCRVRACTNPDHLEPVTRSENLRRGMKRGEHQRAKTHCPYGHEYSQQNTRINCGRRCCRTCDRARSQRTRDKKKCV